MMRPMTLLPFERSWAATMARALVPADALHGTAAQAGVGDAVAVEVERSPWYAALAVRASLWLAWLAPLWLVGRARSFGGLDAETQARVLERLFKHRLYPVRMLGLLLKLTLCTALLGDERVLVTLGAYDLSPRAPARLTTAEHAAPTGEHAAATGAHAAATTEHATATGAHAAATTEHAAPTGEHATATGEHAAHRAAAERAS
jgi:hypothetical protein